MIKPNNTNSEFALGGHWSRRTRMRRHGQDGGLL